jgi:hypothetical protein
MAMTPLDGDPETMRETLVQVTVDEVDWAG